MQEGGTRQRAAQLLRRVVHGSFQLGDPRGKAVAVLVDDVLGYAVGSDPALAEGRVLLLHYRVQRHPDDAALPHPLRSFGFLNDALVVGTGTAVAHEAFDDEVVVETALVLPKQNRIRFKMNQLHVDGEVHAGVHVEAGEERVFKAATHRHYNGAC